MHSEGIANGLAALARLMRRAGRCVAHEKHRKSVEKRGYRHPRISVFSVRESRLFSGRAAPIKRAFREVIYAIDDP